jgi:HEAT repeat protein
LFKAALNDDNEDVRVAAADVLGRLRHADQGLTRLLKERLEDKSLSVRRACAEALMQIDGLGI